MNQLCYWNGHLVTGDEISISVFDLGFVQGVTVSEQLRTFGGQLFRVEEHFQRLGNSLRMIELDSSVDLTHLRTQAEAMVSHNHSLLQPGDDLGLTIFVTPGQSGAGRSGEPTIGMYTAPVPFHRWSRKYRDGERLIISSHRQIPSNCWPSELKCRSRMHYYLADREAQSQDKDARALLLDQDGLISEASTAGVLMYMQSEGLVAPAAEKVLPSISVGILKVLAEQLQIPFVHRDITPGEMKAADEVLLTSTSPCVLPVVSIDRAPVGTGAPGSIFHALISSWSDLVGFDIAEQAIRMSDR